MASLLQDNELKVFRENHRMEVRKLKDELPKEQKKDAYRQLKEEKDIQQAERVIRTYVQARCEHKQTLRNNQSRQRRRDDVVTLRYTTSLQTMPSLMRNGPSKSSPAFSIPSKWSSVFWSCIFRSGIFRNIGPPYSGPAFSGLHFQRSSAQVSNESCVVSKK